VPATVDALLPLSFLEAVRGIDAPQDGAEAEFVPELRNKRLGLSEPISAQIRRYNEAVRRSYRIPYEEAVAIARLVGRRSDAAVVFTTAGQLLARQSYATISALRRRVIRLLPSLLARPLALRATRRIARRYLNGRITRVGSALRLEIASSITLDSAPTEPGCVYYESVLRELLLLLVGETASVEHVECVRRGDPACQWRADWRPIGRHTGQTSHSP
jgi:bacteriochlorophyll 4-vinyl reductase